MHQQSFSFAAILLSSYGIHYLRKQHLARLRHYQLLQPARYAYLQEGSCDLAIQLQSIKNLVQIRLLQLGALCQITPRKFAFPRWRVPSGFY
jgi:hypothetical protein